MAAFDPQNPVVKDKTPGGDNGFSLPSTGVQASLGTQPYGWVAGQGTNGLAAPAVHSAMPDFRQLTNNAVIACDQYRNTELFPRWRRSIRSFNNRHQSGSKYESVDYRHRSKLFVPKTRAMVRSNEAAFAEAFFATTDVVAVRAEDEADPEQLFAASLTHELLNYHLQNTIPWFLILQGAAQTGEVMGNIVSKQYWSFKEKRRKIGQQPAIDPETRMPIFDPVTGQPLYDDMFEVTVTEDKPVIQLIPADKLLVHPGADWLDPVQSSPYVVENIDMFVGDVETRMEQQDSKTGQRPWKKLDRGQILAARIRSGAIDEDMARERENNRSRNPAGREGSQGDTSLDMVRIKECVWRHRGEDLHYFMLGQNEMLTEPTPIEEIYPGYEAERPWAMGYAAVEAFRAYPTSKVELVHPLQQATNDSRNLRMDSLALSVSPERLVRANGSVDVESLRRTVPGKVNLLADLNDVKWDRPPPVPPEAYKEQTVLDQEFDAIGGTFGPASVVANRASNDTATGMSLVSNVANQITRLDIRTTSESWAERALRQVMRLICRFESNPNRFRIAGRKAAIEQFTQTPPNDPVAFAEAAVKLIESQAMVLRLNVGVGATDPGVRMKNLREAFGAAAEMVGPEALQPRLNVDEVLTEIFGAAGYKDGKRFLNQQEKDPAIAMLMDKLKEMQAQIADLEKQAEVKRDVAKINAEAKVEAERLRAGGNVLGEAMRAPGLQAPNEEEAAMSVFEQMMAGPSAAPMPDAPKPAMPQTPAPQGAPMPPPAAPPMPDPAAMGMA